MSVRDICGDHGIVCPRIYLYTPTLLGKRSPAETLDTESNHPHSSSWCPKYHKTHGPHDCIYQRPLACSVYCGIVSAERTFQIARSPSGWTTSDKVPRVEEHWSIANKLSNSGAALAQEISSIQNQCCLADATGVAQMQVKLLKCK